MDLPSGFFTVPTMSEPKAAELELLHSSQEGFCELWRGVKDGKFVVYKCLREPFRGDPIYEGCLRKEYEIGYPLDHPGICRTLGWAQLPGKGNCIELEYLDGTSLDQLLASGSIDKSAARRIVLQICEALSYIHRRGIVHRDIKPSNILITRDGQDAKLMDFGCADKSSWAVLKEAAGTRLYAAPELMAEEETDCRSDIFSLGVTLLEMPLPRIYRRVARKCAKRSPQARYSSCEQVAAATRRAPLRAALWPAAAIAALVAAALIYGSIRSERADHALEDATQSIIEADRL